LSAQRATNGHQQHAQKDQQRACSKNFHDFTNNSVYTKLDVEISV
jgi:hypothetical protein